MCAHVCVCYDTHTHVETGGELCGADLSFYLCVCPGA